jgi:hypothetical protein
MGEWKLRSIALTSEIDADELLASLSGHFKSGIDSGIN